jgi:hypothetical protein
MWGDIIIHKQIVLMKKRARRNWLSLAISVLVSEYGAFTVTQRRCRFCGQQRIVAFLLFVSSLDDDPRSSTGSCEHWWLHLSDTRHRRNKEVPSVGVTSNRTASSYVATHPNAADEDRGARFMPVSRLKGRRGPARASSSQKSRRKRTTTKRLQPSRVQRERLCTRWSRPRPLHLRLERPLRVPRQWALKLRRWPPPMSSNLLPRSRCACPSKF